MAKIKYSESDPHQMLRTLLTKVFKGSTPDGFALETEFPLPGDYLVSSHGAPQTHKLVCRSVCFGEAARDSWTAEMGAKPNVRFCAR